MRFQGKTLRNEFKYYIHIHQYLTLRQNISQLLELDRNSISSDGYGIRSLYFDSPQDHALYDKNDGIFGREKYRIRIYNEKDDRIKLERKSKFGDYVNKESVGLSREEYDRILAGDVDFLAETNVKLLKDFHRKYIHHGFRPTAIVDYKREAYIYPFSDVRITIDKKLSSSVNSLDLFDERALFVEVLPPEKTILEVKFNQFLPEHIRMLVQLHAFDRSTISKYVLCREIGIRHFK